MTNHDDPDFLALKLLHFKLWTCDVGYGCEIYTAPEKGEELLARCFDTNLSDVINRASAIAKCYGHEFDAEDLPCAYCGGTAEELGLSLENPTNQKDKRPE